MGPSPDKYIREREKKISMEFCPPGTSIWPLPHFVATYIFHLGRCKAPVTTLPMNLYIGGEARQVVCVCVHQQHSLWSFPGKE